MTQFARVALIAYFAERTPTRWIGRTALMKCCYFLQVLRNVPLGYSFSLYSYGPFDSNVLGDLGEAEALGLIEETPIPTGYGYKIKRLCSEQDFQDLRQLLSDHESDIDWVIEEFGTKSTSDLELESTIIYVDRESSESGKVLSIESLTRRVHDVKPRFSEATIRTRVELLRDKSVLSGTDLPLPAQSS